MAPNQLLGGRCAKLRVGAKHAFGRPVWCVGGGGCQFRKSFRPRNWPQPTHRRCTIRCFNILDMRPCCLTLGSLKVQQGASEHITQVKSSGESAYKIRIPSRALVLNVFYFSSSKMSPSTRLPHFVDRWALQTYESCQNS